MKIKLVFLDWQENGKSIYSYNKGLHLSAGDFHSGSTFSGTITLDREQEDELRKAILKRCQPCFWVSAFVGEIKPKGKKEMKFWDIYRKGKLIDTQPSNETDPEKVKEEFEGDFGYEVEVKPAKLYQFKAWKKNLEGGK